MKTKVLRIIGISVLLVVGYFLIGCSNAMLPSAEEEEIYPSPTEKTIIYPAEVYYETGTLGAGAQYELWLPRWWNLTGRNLILFVHGYVSPNAEVELPDDIDQETLDLLLSQGFAVAQSSFSETGWAVQDGAYRTVQLLRYIKLKHGFTRNVYLVGASEGGIIALRLTEYKPWLFRGTISLCSLVGGSDLEMAYLAHTRILFDYFFREQLSQLAFLYPAASKLNESLGAGVLDAIPTPDLKYLEPEEFAAFMTPVFTALLMNDPRAVQAMASVTVDGMPLYPWNPGMDPNVVVQEFGAMLAITLWYNIYGTQDLLERTGGKCIVDNLTSHYEITDPALNLLYPDLDASVERLEGERPADIYLWRWYEPKGVFRIPLVTLHTTRDPAVPFFHEYVLQEKAARRGYSDMLAQFQLEGFGHCDLLVAEGGGFVPAEPGFKDALPRVLEYLVTWTGDTGIKPDPAPFGLTPLGP